ncbi:hypothetical protein KM043_016209 [Ampulex compressa]|nr:hypothetical protein KM043_016209 [Ampulex compressa]
MATSQDGETAVTIPLQYNDSHWKSIFEKYDLDGDGKISYQELKAMIRGSAYSNDIPAGVVRIVMRKADLDDSGYLDYPEFIAMIHRKDMQGVFGHLVQRYVHSMVPQRPTAAPQFAPRSSDYPDGQYEEEYSCRPPAVAMIIISILEIMLFLYDVIAHKSLSVEGPAATLFIYNPHKRYQAWRYLTYMFVHVGVFHLVVNLLVQIMLGIPLEMVHKWWRVLIIYIAGVVAGSLGTSVSDPTVYLAGAVAGLLVGINVLRNLEVKRWEKVVWWASIITYSGLMTAAILWNILYTSYYE